MILAAGSVHPQAKWYVGLRQGRKKRALTAKERHMRIIHLSRRSLAANWPFYVSKPLTLRITVHGEYTYTAREQNIHAALATVSLILLSSDRVVPAIMQGSVLLAICMWDSAAR
ncbi:hypothetical protein CBR_g44553 [Chara braunii]|uniref:Uncharacterized protein n=1 Tax=Chara braunii TaxID=69332 RepID=A0A388LXQ3_CHABU|nr:hypothetical protein CBR_g44553 [Chara braunii]|eukprot:GBG87097.1 hypothetical protein CBR_g44553 [Chara braunii]